MSLSGIIPSNSSQLVCQLTAYAQVSSVDIRSALFQVDVSNGTQEYL